MKQSSKIHFVSKQLHTYAMCRDLRRLGAIHQIFPDVNGSVTSTTIADSNQMLLLHSTSARWTVLQ